MYASFKLGALLNKNTLVECKQVDVRYRQSIEADHVIWVCGFSAGLEVGHKFVSRAEMVSIGLHHHWLKGIDYLDKVTDIVSGGSDFKLPRVSLNNHVVDVLKV